MPRIQLSRRQALAMPFLAAARRLSAAGRRPNILVLLADDQGWGDLSFNGNTNVATPKTPPRGW